MNPITITPDQTKALQTLINQTTGANLRVDGILGPATSEGFRAFADRFEGGVVVTGVTGVLRGDGTWPWTARIVGDDIVIDGFATCFGGDADPQDNGETASGLNTKEDSSILGCALPMDGRMFSGLSAAEHRALDGSPIPRMPFRTTMVRIETSSAPAFDVPVIDLGPGVQATTSTARPHVLDLTVAAAKKVNPHASATNFMQRVKATILGGAKYRQVEVG